MANRKMNIALTITILVFSIVAHEVAHGYAANSLGDPTARLAGRLTINPFAHIDLVGSVFVPILLVLSRSPILFGWAKPVPYNPYNLHNQRMGETLVALAGSATNLFIAITFGLIARFGVGTFLSEAALSLIATITFVNLFLGLFNLIPFPPLDGFTALRSSLPWNLSSRLTHFEQIVRGNGLLFLFVFLLFFSYVLAGVFSSVVSMLFGALTGL